MANSNDYLLNILPKTTHSLWKGQLIIFFLFLSYDYQVVCKLIMNLRVSLQFLLEQKETIL